jgi:exodeoxyribonuclease-3
MQIATWNVNSIRTRKSQVLQWLQSHPVDILCLQETKVTDNLFPRSPFEELGYYVYVSGQKSYNGVAILSRSPLENVATGFADFLGGSVAEFDHQKRFLTGTLDNMRIVNLYVPNGGEIDSDKYDYKLKWLAVLYDALQKWLQAESNILVCGDFNIVLEARDVHDPDIIGKRIMASDAERKALQKLLDLGMADAFRKFTTEGGYYSWWDYRGGSFRRNRGWRIDHHYLTPSLYERATACSIDIEPRRQEKPSDHVPVTVEIS